MPMPMVRDILADVARWPQPLQEIVPVNYGEVFLYPDYETLLRLICTMLPQTPMVIPTNGVLMDVELLASLPTLSIVNVSINAAFPETYRAFMGLEPDFEGLEKKIRKLRILAPRVTTWVSFVFDPLYQSDLERDEFIKRWSPIATPQILPAASSNRPDKRPLIPRLRPCRSIFSDIVVGFDGKLTSCCFDPNMNLELSSYSGDLLKDWRNPQLEELRHLHNEGRRQEVELCQGCTYE